MGQLHGQFDVTLDARRRVRIPRAVARMLGERADGSFVLLRGRDGRPWLLAANEFGKLLLKGLLRGHASVVKPASYLTWDRRRQITLPKSIFSDFALKRDLTLVCVRDHLELWNRDEWDVYSERVRSRSAADEIARPPE